MDKQLLLVERSFFYLPFEHAESLKRQQQSVALYRALVAEAGAEEQEYFQGALDYAIRHQVIIASFGRYPHRNAILGTGKHSRRAWNFCSNPALHSE